MNLIKEDRVMQSPISISKFLGLIEVLDLYIMRETVVKSGKDLDFMDNAENLEKIITTCKQLSHACHERLNSIHSK